MIVLIGQQRLSTVPSMKNLRKISVRHPLNIVFNILQKMHNLCQLTVIETRRYSELNGY